MLLVVLALSACSGGDGDSASSTTRPAGDTAPSGLPDAGAFDETDVVVGEDPFELEGTLRIPEGATADGPVPGVVIVGGFGPTDEDGTQLGLKPYRDLGEGLADAGIATLTYDKRSSTYGDSFLGDYTIEDEVVDDARAAIGVLADDEAVDPDQIFVVGHGLGGMMAPRIADEGEPVAGLVLLAAPSGPIPDLTIAQTRYMAELDGSVTPEEQAEIDSITAQAAAIADPDLAPTTPADQLLGTPAVYWLSLRDYDQVTAADDLGLPILALQGDRSYEVTSDDFAAWQELAAGSEQVQATLFPGLNYYFVAGDEPSTPEEYAEVGVVEPQVIDDIAAFILA